MDCNSSARDGGAKNTALRDALTYRAAGLSVTPIRRDGSKSPYLDGWQNRRLTEEEIRALFDTPNPPGIGIVCGKVSDNLELLDFDEYADTIFPAWRELVEAECPGLVAQLCVVQTPDYGYHCRYRCRGMVIPGNTKLAQEPYKDPTTGKPKRRTLIETRGEGGQGLAPGCPPECHPSGRLYVHHSGPPLTDLQDITPEEREVLLRCARSSDWMPPSEPKARQTRQRKESAGLLPGDDFCRRGPDWRDILEPHGWERARQSGAVSYWRRPGKDGRGWSATTGYCRSDKSGELFAVFSSNADPFEGPAGGKSCSCYSKFSAFTMLNHGGDFKAAAKALAADGYGDQGRKAAGPWGQDGQADDGTHPHVHTDTGGESADVAADDGRPPQHACGKGDVRLGPLTLRLAHARRTGSGRLHITVAITEGGKPRDELDISNTESARQKAAARLRQMLGADAEARERVDAAIAELIVAGSKDAATAPDKGVPPVLEVVRQLVPDLLDVRFRTERGGLWSERERREITRAEFITGYGTRLLEAVAKLSPVQPPGGILDFVQPVRCALEIVWTDLRTHKPEEVDANLGKDSAAAAAFWETVSWAWRKPKTFEKAKTVDAEVAALSSLIQRVKTAAVPYLGAKVLPNKREKWREAKPAFPAWWRPVIAEDGQPAIRLAMRWDLPRHMDVALPGVHDQLAFSTLGERYGVFDQNPPVSEVAEGGTKRVAVLTRERTDELLAAPDEHEEATTPEEAETH
jgi:hypothetical protein